MIDFDMQKLLIPLVDVAIEPARWADILVELTVQIGGTASAVAVHDFQTKIGHIDHAVGYDPYFRRQYKRRFAYENIWLQASQPYKPEGRITIGEDIVPEQVLVQSGFYQQWLEPQEFHHRMSVSLVVNGPRIRYLEIMRPRTAPAFSPASIDRLREVVPHLQRSLRISDHLAAAEATKLHLQSVLDHYAAGVVVVDHSGRIIEMNGQARKFLADGTDVSVAGGKIAVSEPHEDLQLRRAIVRVSHDRHGKTAETVLVQRASTRSALHLDVLPLQRDDRVTTGSPELAAVVILDTGQALRTSSDRLQRIYGLTRAEARISLALAQVGSLDEAAVVAGIAKTTARGYLAKVFAKTGVNRQGELVRLVLSDAVPPRLQPTGVPNH